MTFRIDPEPKFWTSVRIALPGEPAQTFRARYRVIDIGEAGGFDLDTADGTAAFLAAAVCDLDDIEDEGGRRPEFSDALLARLIGLPHVRAALARAYVEGVAAAARGN